MDNPTCPRCGQEAKPAGTCNYAGVDGTHAAGQQLYACTGDCTIVPENGDGTPERLEFIVAPSGRKTVVEPGPSEFA